MSKRKTMPILARGPIIVSGIFLIALIFYGLHRQNIIVASDHTLLRIFICILGVFMTLSGLGMYLASIFHARLIENIQAGKLITTGIYAWVRHPLYAGLAFLAEGLLLVFTSDGKMIIAGFLMYVWLKIMLIQEEKMLVHFFPKEYPRYREKVNQLLPYKRNK